MRIEVCIARSHRVKDVGETASEFFREESTLQQIGARVPTFADCCTSRLIFRGRLQLLNWIWAGLAVGETDKSMVSAGNAHDAACCGSDPGRFENRPNARTLSAEFLLREGCIGSI